MGLINYKDIDFKQSINKENKVINFNGSEIQIVNYLSANDKYDLIMVTLQKSFEKNIYNPFKMDMYFNLNVIYSYTNIVFDDEDTLDEAELYDTLESSGLIDKVLAEIDTEELAYLHECIVKLAKTITKYRNTFGAVVGSFFNDFPERMEETKEIVNEFDLEKLKPLLALAGQIKDGLI